MFKVLSRSKHHKGRRGVIYTKHGKVKTPCFMTIATRGSVKGVSIMELKKAKADIILANTYHLFLEPGLDVIKKAGGLHSFMGWQGPLLTDSGGYQVFSLGRLRKIRKDGVEFVSDKHGGRKDFLTPEKVLEIQDILGSDIQMVLDVCAPYPCDFETAKKACDLTYEWAKRSKKIKKPSKILRFGIVQGSVYEDLRIQSARDIISLDFDGYAIGGLAVGEDSGDMLRMVDVVVPELPENKPRYLMGVGKPEQLIEAIKRGIDMFDCVIPTREARHGRLYIFKEPGSRGTASRSRAPGAGLLYEILNIKRENNKFDFSPVDQTCTCRLCKNYSRAYLRHLFKIEDPLALVLASEHNINFYLRFLRSII